MEDEVDAATAAGTAAGPDARTPSGSATGNELVRQQTFDCDGPVELEVELGPGLVEIRLADDAESAVHVEVRHAPDAGGSWSTGLTGLLNWVGQFGSWGDDLPAQAIRETTISQQGRRIVVRAPRAMPMRGVPLGIVVLAPPGSDVTARTGSGDIRVSGTAGNCALAAGSGHIWLDRADGRAHVRTGSGRARLGTIGGSLSVGSGSGDLEISTLSDSATVSTGSGDVWIGTVQGDLTAKTGSGDLTIADAAGGVLQLTTGSGDLRVGIRSGVVAVLDLSTGSGRARSDLPVTTGAPAPANSERVVQVRGRTGSGDAIVTRATA